MFDNVGWEGDSEKEDMFVSKEVSESEGDGNNGNGNGGADDDEAEER